MATFDFDQKTVLPLFIERLNRSLDITQSRHILLGYSGGQDSTVLLDLLYHFQQTTKRKLTYSIVYVNHNLSVHAHEWGIHCAQKVAVYGLPFNAISVTLQEKKSNIEAQARKLRYQAFQSLMTQESLLLTAHHLDDQTETFLLALKRGSGPKGLSSMPSLKPLDKGNQYRPLLPYSKTALETYAIANKLDWIEDESNNNCEYDRNFLRNTVLPLLKKRWPSFLNTTTRSIELITQEHQLLHLLLEEKLRSVSETENRLNCKKLQEMGEVLASQLIRLWLAQSDRNLMLPTQKQLQRIYFDLICAKAESDPCFETTDYQLRISYGLLYRLPKFSNLDDVTIPVMLNQPIILPDHLGRWILALKSRDQLGSLSIDQQRETTRNCLLLNPPTPQQTITIRFNGTGIHCQPQGRTKKHRLKMIYQRERIPSWERKRIPLLFYDEQLVAVGDRFVCDHVAVTPRSDSPLFCELIWEPSISEA